MGWFERFFFKRNSGNHGVCDKQIRWVATNFPKRTIDWIVPCKNSTSHSAKLILLEFWVKSKTKTVTSQILMFQTAGFCGFFPAVSQIFLLVLSNGGMIHNNYEPSFNHLLTIIPFPPFRSIQHQLSVFPPISGAVSFVPVRLWHRYSSWATFQTGGECPAAS